MICLGDTLMSVLAGFSVFAMMGVLSNELDTDIEKVITSGKQTFFPLNSMVYLVMNVRIRNLLNI